MQLFTHSVFAAVQIGKLIYINCGNIYVIYTLAVLLFGFVLHLSLFSSFLTSSICSVAILFNLTQSVPVRFLAVK